MASITDCLNPGFNRIEHVLENAKAKGVADDVAQVRKLLLTATAEGKVSQHSTKEPGVLGYKLVVNESESDEGWLPPPPAST